MKYLAQFAVGNFRWASRRYSAVSACIVAVALVGGWTFCIGAQSLPAMTNRSRSAYKCAVDTTSSVVAGNLVSTQRLKMALSILIAPFETNGFNVLLTNAVVSTETHDKNKLPPAATNSFAPRLPELLIAVLQPDGSIKLRNFENWLKSAEGPGVEAIYGVFNQNSLKLLLTPILREFWMSTVDDRPVLSIQRPFNTGFSEIPLNVDLRHRVLAGDGGVQLSGEHQTNFVVNAKLPEDVNASIAFQVILHEPEGVMLFTEISSARTSTPAARANIETRIRISRERE